MSATIVVGHINDEELKNSISSLVDHVRRETDTMTGVFDEAITKMENRLKSLGGEKVDLGQGVSGKESTAIKQEKELAEAKKKTAQAQKEVNMKLDEGAQIQSRVARASSTPIASAKESALGFIEGYREKARALAEEIKKVESLSMQQGIAQIEKLGAQADAARARIAHLEERMRELRSAPSSGRFETLARTQQIDATSKEIENLKQKIRELDAEAKKITPDTAQSERLAQMRGEYENMRQVMRDISQTFADMERQQKAVAAAAAEATKNMQGRGKDATTWFTDSEGKKHTIRNAKNVNIEEEILKVEERITAEKQRQREVQAQLTQSTREYSAEVKNLAQSIRESGTLKKDALGGMSGIATINGTAVYLTENLAMGLRLEDQIEQALNRANTQRQQGVTLTREQAEAERRAEEALGLVVSAEEARNAKKRAYATPITNAQEINNVKAALAVVTKQSHEWWTQVDKTKASYAELSNYAAYLKSALNNVGQNESLHSVRLLRDELRQVESIMARIKRPFTLSDAMKGEENSIDAIMRKMQQLQAYKRGLNFTDPKQASELRIVDDKLNQLDADLKKYTGTTKLAQGANTALTRSWNYMKNRLAFYFTVGASTQFIKNLIEVRSQYEMTERSLGILVQSAERGSEIFRELSSMALVSPYTLIELSSAAKQLTAYDIAAKDVVDTTRRLGDMAAAVGIPIDRLTYALGQIKAYGYLNARDARMFSNAGIPLVAELSRHYSELHGTLVSVADVYDMIKKKQVGMEDVMSVITEMTDEGGKFFNFQEKLAGTLKVELANLTLAWNNMLNDVGESSEGVLRGTISLLKDLFLHWEQFSRQIYGVATAYGIYKAAQLALNALLGKGVALQLKTAMATKEASTAEYLSILSKKKLSKETATLLLIFNQHNKSLASAIMRLGFLTKEEIRATLGAKGLQKALMVMGNAGKIAIAGLATAFKSLLTVAAPLFLFSLVTDVVMQAIEAGGKIEEQNKVIADHAKEAADNIKQVLKREELLANVAAATSGTLSAEDARKTWEELREEIETNTTASKSFINELLAIPDINERIGEAWTLLGKVQETANALSGLEKELSVSQDWAWGLLGEGLAEDIEDYVEFLEELRNGTAGVNSKQHLKAYRDEAEKELTQLANDIEKVLRDKLGDEGILDPQKVKEALARIKAGIKEENPQIHGAVERLFDVELDKMMHERLGNVYSETTSLWTIVLERIKRDSGSAFQNITDDVLEETSKWSPVQEKAIKDAIEKLRNELPPEFSAVLDTMQADLNSREWKINITAAFEVENRTALQKAFDEQFRYAGALALQGTAQSDQLKKNDERYLKYRIKAGETTVQHQKRLQDLQKNITEELNVQLAIMQRQSNVNSVQYKTAFENAERLRQQNKDLQAVIDWHGYTPYTPKTGKTRGGKHTPKPEDLVAKALKDEISLIKEMQSNYDKLRKAGVRDMEAIDIASQGYEKTIASINVQLRKFGIKEFAASDFAGKDTRAIRDALQKQLNDLLKNKKIKRESLKELEVTIQKLNVDVKQIDAQKIVETLNSELQKIDEEYELALAFDGDPQLAEAFAEMFRLDEGFLDSLPHGIMEKYQKIQDALTKALNKGYDLAGKNIFNLFDIQDLHKWAEGLGLDTSSALFKEIEKAYKGLRKERREMLKETEKEFEDAIKSFGLLGDKIGEIEGRRLDAIKKLKEATPADKQDSRNIEYTSKLDAINKKAEREKTSALFEDFKNSDLYIAMFQRIGNASTIMLETMRDRLEKVKASLKDLTPEQLKFFAEKMEQIDLELVKRNPFKKLASNTKAYFKAFSEQSKAQLREQLKSKQEQYDIHNLILRQLEESYEKEKHAEEPNQKMLDYLNGRIIAQRIIVENAAKELQEVEALANQYNLLKKVVGDQWRAIAKGATTAAANLQSLGQLRDFIQNDLGIELSAELNGLVDGLTKVGEGINNVISSASSGNVVGALTGVGQIFYGIFDGFASLFGGGSARTKKLEKDIERSERAVKRLEVAYADLEHAMNKAYGTAVIGAQKAAIENKKLQLTELNRQLQLEQSKRSKDQDEDKIIDLQKQIKQLENEIQDATDDITNNLLGISSIGDAVENMVGVVIDALRSGEDAIGAFNESIDDMIVNLIKKFVATKMLAPIFEKAWDAVQERIMARKTGEEYARLVKREAAFRPYADVYKKTGAMRYYYEEWVKAKEELAKYDEVTKDDLRYYIDVLNGLKGEGQGLVDFTEELLKEYGLGKTGDKELSALQQGIQSITEETANAIEAYLNGISQQVYLHSDLLTQIRDAVVALDADVQTTTQAQMLLQLQQSYQVQMSIQGILEGWSNPNGMAVRVEMV